MILLNENKKGLVSISNDKNKEIIFKENSLKEAIKLIYNAYFEYDETIEETKTKEEEKNDLITEEIVENKTI